MATVTKTPSGMYLARAFLGVDEDGRQVRKSFTDPDRRIALSLALAYEAQFKDKISHGSFAYAMNKFLKAKEKLLSPSTVAEYYSRRRMLREHFPEFCAKNCVSITSDDLNSLVMALMQETDPRHKGHTARKALAPKTIQNYMRFISAVMRHQGLNMPPYSTPSRRIPDIYVPTDAEVSQLIRASKGTEMYVPVMLAAFGPLRRGEVCALTWPRDFNGNVIHVRESIAVDRKRKAVRKAPKTYASDRFIEIPAEITEAVAEQGYVTRLAPGSISKRFKPLLRRAGLPEFRFHDLRHYCVSTLHAQGVPDAYIMKRGGWVTDHVLKAVYRHTMADQERAFASRALNHFQSVFDA